MFSASSKNGKGYGFFMVALLNFQKSSKYFSLPFFLSTTIMGDNHVASSIGWINLVTNNFSMSYLKVIA
jgi:hypothetical protein